MLNTNANNLPGLGTGTPASGLPANGQFWVDDTSDQMVDDTGEKMYFLDVETFYLLSGPSKFLTDGNGNRLVHR